MRRGDVLWVDLKNPPGGRGHEQAGRRPSVAITLGDEDADNPMLTVVPCTKAMDKESYPHTMTVEPSDENGLTEKSVLMGFQIVSLDKRRVIKVVGRLEEAHFRELEDLLRNLLSL
jgi:mRNA-degrading endonuclease toxin of MazEF toxin-antitoxin module